MPPRRAFGKFLVGSCVSSAMFAAFSNPVMAKNASATPLSTTMAGLLYYSSRSGNTDRFVARLGRAALRIPVSPSEPMPEPPADYVLICPTYADGEGRGAVPKQVIRFLNDAGRRAGLRGRPGRVVEGRAVEGRALVGTGAPTLLLTRTCAYSSSEATARWPVSCTPSSPTVGTR